MVGSPFLEFPWYGSQIFLIITENKWQFVFFKTEVQVGPYQGPASSS